MGFPQCRTGLWLTWLKTKPQHVGWKKGPVLVMPHGVWQLCPSGPSCDITTNWMYFWMNSVIANSPILNSGWWTLRIPISIFSPISIGNHIVRIHHEPLGITISIENYLQQVPSCKRCVGGWYHVTLVMSCDMFFSSWLWKNNFFWFTFGCMKHGCYHFWQRKHQWCGKLLGFSSPVSSKFRVPQL